MPKMPKYERNRRIQLLVNEANEKHYAVHFRPRSRIFMINGLYYKEIDGLKKLKELLRK